MKIMIVGAWAWPQYEEAFSRGLRENAVEVSALDTSVYFKGFWGRIQQTIPLPGPALRRLNREVVAAVERQRPVLILFWRPTHVLPNTIRRLANMGIKVSSYNNDDPFGPRVHRKVPWHHHVLWHWYIKGLPRYDFNFFYRKINCEEAKAFGARHALGNFQKSISSDTKQMWCLSGTMSGMVAKNIFVHWSRQVFASNYGAETIGAMRYLVIFITPCRLLSQLKVASTVRP
jgi:hypothetical protein